MQILNLQDYPSKIHEIISIMFDEWYDDFYKLGIKSIDDMYANLNKDSLDFSHTIIAIDDKEYNNLLGFITIFDSDMGIKMSNHKFIGNLYVKPGYRNKGTGKHLMTSAILYAKNILQLDTIYLWTYTRKLKEWYENIFGFTTEVTFQNYLSYKEIYIMCKEF